jgi:hypothetical protein
MDRLARMLGVAGLALSVVPASSGCRSLRSEVPPGRPFASDGKPTQPLNFGSAPNPATGPGVMPSNGLNNSGANPYGLPAPGSNSNPYGVTSRGAFGGVNTSNAGMATDSSTTPSGAAAASPPAGANPSTSIPQGGAAGAPNRWSNENPGAASPGAPTTNPFN